MEIVHRKLSFALALVVVVVAVAYTVSTVTLARGYQLRSEAHVAQLNDEIRKITKNMGFNIDIMPKELNLADLYATDFGESTMSYDLVNQLANSHDIVTINHLRPSLIRKVRWTEKDRDVIAMGVAAVVPWAHRKNPKIPLEPAIPPGKVVVGAVLADQLDLKVGQQVVFRGQSLTIEKIHPPRGSSDDITLWIDLAMLQEMLDLQGRINMIQALECNCATIDRLGEVRMEIEKELGGGVQVIERATIALSRAEARKQVQAEGKATLGRVQRHALNQTLMLAIGTGALVGLLMFINARDRRSEVGVLRALGTSRRQIVQLFVGKAILLGLLGSVIGCAIGFAMGVRTATASAGDAIVDLPLTALFIPGFFAAVIAGTTVLVAIACWVPATMAARQDPATILSQD